MLAKVVPYGGNAVRYASEKEKAKVVKVNHMPEGIDPTAIWYMMKHHCQLHQQDRTLGRSLERLMVQFVISPSKEEATNFTMKDWANLQDESLETLDSVGLIPTDMKKEVKTNFRNSMNVGGLHSDSKSGTLHLHMDCCRVDLDGNTNDVHDIHKRAMMAAEIINMRHGWKQPKEIRDMRKQEIADFCEYTLQKMQEFDVDFYFKMLRMKGYEVTPRYDKNKKLVGYTIDKNASVFKASEISRRYMASQLEATWKKFHPKPAQVRVKPASPTVTPCSHPSRPVPPKSTSTHTKVQPKFSQVFSQVFSQSLHQLRPFSISILAVRSRRSGFLIRSRILSSKRLRFLMAMILPQLRTLPILQCFSLLATLMLPRPCPNLAEEVAVLLLNLAGARKMMRMNAPMPADA